MAAPPIDHLLEMFDFIPLPEGRRAEVETVRLQYQQLADVVATGPANVETTVALRELLASKDAAVRAIVADAR